MNDQEKQELARWLAERLDIHPAPLDGNFAAAVIAAMRRQSSKVWFYFHAEVSKGLSDVGTEFPMVVCLAARAALEGGGE